MKDEKLRKKEWETTVRAWGNTGGILIPKSLVGKRVKITLEVLE